MSDKLHSAHLAIGNALADLATLFRPGMKLTFIARHPDHAERHIIVTDDRMTGLAELLASEAQKEQREQVSDILKEESEAIRDLHINGKS